MNYLIIIAYHQEGARIFSKTLGKVVLPNLPINSSRVKSVSSLSSSYSTFASCSALITLTQKGQDGFEYTVYFIII